MLRPSFRVRPAVERVDEAGLGAYLDSLGREGLVARELDRAVNEVISTVSSLSSLSAPLALEYLERLQRPIPSLTLERGVEAVTRGYAAHLAVEAEPGRFGAPSAPSPPRFPKLRRGSPPQGLLTRVVKASRRGPGGAGAFSTPAWEGFVRCCTRRLHDQVADPGEEGLLDVPVVSGLVRFGWTLREMDLGYGLEPERQGGP